MAKYYQPKGHIDIPCFIETSKTDLADRVCFAVLLAPEYAEYRPAVLSVPAEFEPFVSSENYLVTNIAEPWLRLPLVNGKVYFKTANPPQEIIVCGVTESH